MLPTALSSARVLTENRPSSQILRQRLDAIEVGRGPPLIERQQRRLGQGLGQQLQPLAPGVADDYRVPGGTLGITGGDHHPFLLLRTRVARPRHGTLDGGQEPAPVTGIFRKQHNRSIAEDRCNAAAGQTHHERQLSNHRQMAEALGVDAFGHHQRTRLEARRTHQGPVVAHRRRSEIPCQAAILQ